MSASESWSRFKASLCEVASLGLVLDPSRMGFGEADLARLEAPMKQAFTAMEALERGAVSNPDERRQVGHYWLRAPGRAPSKELGDAIRKTLADVKTFAAGIHEARLRPPKASRFTQVLSIGIGGSALGPMFVADALGEPGRDRMAVHFLDNTDPDGFARVLRGLAGKLPEMLTVVISKSGSTPEPRNAMLAAAAAYRDAGLDFAKQAVAVTGEGSRLDAEAAGWLARFPMWEWVGGRTSETSAVGLLPAALQGLDIDGLLAGAAECDEATRIPDLRRNPAALMAAHWHLATDGRGSKDLVLLPYKDRLLLFSRYLQQLIMESLGKRLDLEGRRVDQGLSVYGNKGSTDQHAYVQQLRDGVPNFFVTFIRVLESGGEPLEVEPGITAGDYLHGFLLGTREALSENGRGSMTITIPRVDARRVGALIALFERAVGLYASLVGINAYHQPGVEAGKKAASAVLALQAKLAAALSSAPRSAEELATVAGAHPETAYLVLEHLAAQGRARVASGRGPDAAFTKA
jgi:glucose-6-phosphate isomerase